MDDIVTWVLHHGDCRDVLATLPDCSIDSVVTDPPYELGFMGKKWDNSGIAYSVEMWREVLRVLKPGGHVLAFGGTRTYHRMAVAIEDAGFEIRDSIHWIYGSGFPKSLDVSKAIDKQRHDRKDILRVADWLKPLVYGVGVGKVAEAFGVSSTMVSQHWCSHSQTTVPTLEQVPTLLEVLGVEADDVPEDIRRLLWDLNGRKGQPGENWWKREVVGVKAVSGERGVAGGMANGIASLRNIDSNLSRQVDITAPATDAARQWSGWGTALKPAHEPIVVARRPLIGTVAANVLQHGTGALNIDGTRVATSDANPSIARRQGATNHLDGGKGRAAEHNASGRMVLRSSPESFRAERAGEVLGRWPANVIFDPDAAAELDRQQEGASRFFYVPKPSKAERNAGLDDQNRHPTVKPLALMRYLVRLVTPPGGTVLDPFAGSGTTLMAAVMEGFNSIGIELTADYPPIIRGRVAWAENQMQPEPQPTQEARRV